MTAHHTAIGDDDRSRCFWGSEPDIYRAYHDQEWGRPVTTDHGLLEKLCLEGFQSGLSWLTILRKRAAFRAAFAGFDPAAVAAFDESDVQRLLQDASIVRHRGKIESTINNANRALDLIGEFGNLARFVAGYRPEPATRPAEITWQWLSDHPTSAESTALAKELKHRGWSYVGPTTVYAFMQSVGLVNDHLEACWVRADVETAQCRWVQETELLDRDGG
jgi:DNA-3-methyladenine glycosylase I